MTTASPQIPDPHDSLEVRLTKLLTQAVSAVAPDAAMPVVLERARQAQHGDYATPVALQLAKTLRRAPRDVAHDVMTALPASPWIEKVEMAGPGFINIFITAAARHSIISDILRMGSTFGSSSRGQGQRIQVEFVSSNPTGPLHVGHGRGAAFGASVANLLVKVGFSVHREYYVNDAGRQMDILTVSTWLRALQHAGLTQGPFPPNGYQGDYVTLMAVSALQRFSLDQFPMDPLTQFWAISGTMDEETQMDALIATAKSLLGPAYHQLHGFVLAVQLADCKADLEEFGVSFDEWFSEQSLFDSGAVAEVVSRLEAEGHIYLQNGARWFRSSAFGDEKDRVVQRDNGLFTYFASDIAYHVNKFDRGFDLVLDLWGADHHGYIPRVRAALRALGYDDQRLKVPLVQFVSLFRHGEKAQMSTRKGQFVTLRELRSEVGNDAARFFYVLRKSDQHLDFDLDLATSQSQDNPVYYIQYAHARIHRVLQRWNGDQSLLSHCTLEPLTHPAEIALMQSLRAYPSVVDQAAVDYAPHSVAFYLRDLAAEFHAYYNAVPFLDTEPVITAARLALLSAIAQLLKDGLSLLGVSAPETM
ncbi:MAG: arginine--tRNA ligase [Ferrovum sp.]|nr:arginine--tRNA ligase [Ferrovum sp.]NDU87979.1 arginine--tRNA ligase [Ferrovum sp.]